MIPPNTSPPTDLAPSSRSPQDNVSVATRKSAMFSHVWWIPLIALFIGLYLMVTHYTSQGPRVTIRFTHADGVEAGKTKIRFKDVEVGHVEKLVLSEDLKTVLVSARFNKEASNLLRQTTQFWIVKPRLELTKISGLETVLSGSYITLSPGKPEDELVEEFEGLIEPPIVSQETAGLHLTLLSQQANSINVGTSIYYNGMPVGSVERKYFSDDYLWVKLDVFVEAPHDKLLNAQSKFWSTNGIALSTTSDGFNIQVENLEALFAGGIAFNAPDSVASALGPSLKNGDEFLLYSGVKEADADVYGEKLVFVSYFSGDVKGLTEGANVEFQGIPIGRVRSLRLIFDSAATQPKIPVIFEIYRNRFSFLGVGSENDLNRTLNTLIANGLQASVETGNFLTGSKYISLNFNGNNSNSPMSSMNSPDATNAVSPQTAKLLRDNITGQIIIPSAAESFSAITSGVASVVKKLDTMPLTEITEEINQLLNNVNRSIDNGRLEKLLASIDNTVKQLGTLSGNTEKSIISLEKSLTEFSKTTQSVMNGLSPDAPLYHNLNETLKTLNTTLESIQRVSDKVDRKPNALIFGEGKR